MVKTRHQKQAALEQKSPLFDDILLRNVLSYCTGAYLYVGQVCKKWAAVYKSLNRVQADHALCEHDLLCDTLTAVSHAFASVKCLDQAAANGLNLSLSKTQHQAGVSASVEVLQRAHALGLPFTNSVCAGCIRSGRLSKVLWMHSSSDWCSPPLPVYTAAESGSLDRACCRHCSNQQQLAEHQRLARAWGCSH
jgi:hypothetical protein